MSARRAWLLLDDEDDHAEPPAPPADVSTRDPAEDAVEERDEDRLLKCAHCLEPITRTRDRIAVQGKHQHTCVNPHGFIYTVGCFARARGCHLSGSEETYWSWFSGYAWTIAQCGRCGEHLGWRFRGAESAFWGLVLERLAEG